MDKIFHEKQEGQLCAQHALNALLQMKLWDAVNLAQIAERLDEQEKEKMAEGGINSPEYQAWLKSGSKNMDDSGYFSLQVIQSALATMDIQLINYTSEHEIAVRCRQVPTEAQAYIVHFNQHWYTIRKIGHQWFNLNSLLSGPELLSESYLHLLLSQLINEKNHIFIVIGNIPDSDADKYIRNHPIDPKTVVKPSLKNASSGDRSDENYMMALADAEEAIKAVADATTDSDGWTSDEKMLLRDTIEASRAASAAQEEKNLQRILEQSLIEMQQKSVNFGASSSRSSTTHYSSAFESHPLPSASTSSSSVSFPPPNLSSLSEDEMLAMAIQMSQDQ